MLSALKRIVNNNNNNNSTNINNTNTNNQNVTTEQHQSISQALQKKFSKGVNYNSETSNYTLVHI